MANTLIDTYHSESRLRYSFHENDSIDYGRSKLSLEKYVEMSTLVQVIVVSK